MERSGMLVISFRVINQRSKLTFSKSCLLATFNNCKTVATKKNSVANKKKKAKGRILHDILHVAKKEREGEDTS